jgi:hypothetical protein
MDIIAQDTYSTTEGSLGPLCDFPLLSSLEVSLPVLFGIEDINMGRKPALSAFLPPALQHLTITDDLFMYGEFQEHFEDVAAMKFFRAYLAGERPGETWSPDLEHAENDDNWNEGRGYKNMEWVQDRDPEWKAATPGLKKFTYDLRRRGGLSFGYWNMPGPREQFVGLCEEQGIKGEVLFEDPGS